MIYWLLAFHFFVHLACFVLVLPIHLPSQMTFYPLQKQQFLMNKISKTFINFLMLVSHPHRWVIIVLSEKKE